jgi:hypothetical protein
LDASPISQEITRPLIATLSKSKGRRDVKKEKEEENEKLKMKMKTIPPRNIGPLAVLRKPSSPPRAFPRP